MPVHSTTAYYADCDECDWVSENTPDESQAEHYLDHHIREKHWTVIGKFDVIGMLISLGILACIFAVVLAVLSFFGIIIWPAVLGEV